MSGGGRVNGAAGGWPALRRGAVLFEDEAVLVLDKPAGLSVMGERHDTDLVRLAEESGERLFPVHRIDKATSGVLLLARELRFHADLTRQFNRRTVEKVYLALTRSTGLPPRGTIDLPLGVGRKNRVRVAGNRNDIAFDEAGARWWLPEESLPSGKKNYPSHTSFERLWEGAGHTLLAVRPTTGRRHQIRVHLAWTGHAIEGDPLFGRSGTGSGPGPAPDAGGGGRMCLHSWRLSFDAAWAGGGRPGAPVRMRVEAPVSEDFLAPVREELPPAAAADLLRRACAAGVPGAAGEPGGTDGTGEPGGTDTEKP